MSYLKALTNINKLLPSSKPRRHDNQHWVAPAVGYYKLNVNALINFHSRSAAVGGLVRDNNGMCLDAFNAPLSYC